MSEHNLGKLLVIANPQSNSGKGADAIHYARRFFSMYKSAYDSLAISETTASGDALRIAKEAGDCDTVVALGGDGIIHEVVNGLMQINASSRPALGVIPVGTGNDYARTIGMPRGNIQKALSQLIFAKRQKLDLGLVNGCYFMQTLSFGLDAAIALDTIDRRASGDSSQGTHLFVSSALRILSKSSKGWVVRADIDGEKRVLQEIIFAVQVGPTYGAGFRICPRATPTDGLLDVCFNKRIPAIPHALALLGRARFGNHTSSSLLELTQAQKIVLDFDVEPPCQIDGEKLTGTHFEIRSVPAALEVYLPT